MSDQYIPGISLQEKVIYPSAFIKWIALGTQSVPHPLPPIPAVPCLLPCASSRWRLPHGLPAGGDKQVPALGQPNHESPHVEATDLAHTIVSPHGQKERQCPCGADMGGKTRPPLTTRGPAVPGASHLRTGNCKTFRKIGESLRYMQLPYLACRPSGASVSWS